MAPAGRGAAEVNDWWRRTAAQAAPPSSAPMRSARRSAFSPCLDASIGPILTHGAVEAVNEVLRAQG
jgi:putative mRNA 3-end processing factor